MQLPPCDCVSIHRRRDALSTWKSRLGSQATYRALVEIFVKAGRVDCAEAIVEILKEGAETPITDTPPSGAAGTLGTCYKLK